MFCTFFTFFNVLKASNIKFGQQVNIIEKVPLGTLPQAVVMSLAHNHATNPLISSYRGAKNYQIWAVKATVTEVDKALHHWE